MYRKPVICKLFSIVNYLIIECSYPINSTNEMNFLKYNKLSNLKNPQSQSMSKRNGNSKIYFGMVLCYTFSLYVCLVIHLMLFP